MLKRKSKNNLMVINHLKQLVLSLYISGDRLEDQFWEREIQVSIRALLDKNQQTTLDEVVDTIHSDTPGATGMLIDLIETFSQSIEINQKNSDPLQAMLIAAPILVWSNYKIPNGLIQDKLLKQIETDLLKSVIAPDNTVVICPYLCAVEQLPQSHTDVFQLTKKMIVHTNKTSYFNADSINVENNSSSIDVRYLIGLVTAPKHAPLFRWQTTDSDGQFIDKQTCLSNWQNAFKQSINQLLIGCEFQCLLPDAYYSVCREADERLRPHLIKNAVSFLSDAMNLLPKDMRAVIGGFGDENINEFRISLTKRNNNEQVFHGIIWPIYGIEKINGKSGGNFEQDSIDQINSLLHDAGIKDIRHIYGCFKYEYCEECDEPFYLNGLGGLRHVEQLEPIEDKRLQFH